MYGSPACAPAPAVPAHPGRSAAQSRSAMKCGRTRDAARGAAARSTEVFARVSDPAGKGGRGNSVGAGQEDLGLLVAHAAGEVPVGGADALHGGIEATKGIDRAAEAGGA